MNIEDMKKIASTAIVVADHICIEADRLRVFCHEVIAAVESAEEDFKIVTLDGDRAVSTYLALKAKIAELADSIPTKVPEMEEP